MKDPSYVQSGSKRFQAFMVVDGWRSDEIDSGADEPFVTRPITVDTSPWAIVWSSGEGGMSVTLRDARSLESTPLEELLEASQGGQGIRYVDRAGTFRLTVEGEGLWVVKVVELS